MTHFFVKLHTVSNIKAVSFTYPLENFTLDWFVLHNQRLWWLWQIWSMLLKDTKMSQISLSVNISVLLFTHSTLVVRLHPLSTENIIIHSRWESLIQRLMNANFVGGIVEIANGEEQSKVQNKTETMIPAVEQHCDKFLDPIIKESFINQCLIICFWTLCHNENRNENYQTKNPNLLILVRHHIYTSPMHLQCAKSGSCCCAFKILQNNFE